MCSNHVLPFYVACDESFSMMDHLDTLNEGLVDLYRAVATDPVVAGRTRLCLIGFSGSAEVLLPLSKPDDIVGLPTLTASSGTSFGAVFSLLRRTIDHDVALLRRAHKVHRPAVFFLSDGQPTDPATWREAYAELADPGWSARPHMIAFGVGDADAGTIGRIGAFRAYMARDRVSPGSALRGFSRALTASIVETGRSAGDHADPPRLREHVDGFGALPGCSAR